MRHFLSITDLSRDEIFEVFERTKELKSKQKQGEPHRYLEGKTLAMIFQKPSARTRVSFEVGMVQLGGHALYLGPNDLQVGKREVIRDVARTLSRYVDVMMARLFGHADIVELSRFSTVPVINGLTDLLHPCQVMADVFTIWEKLGRAENYKVAFIGDGNNMAHSWLNIASRLSMHLSLAVPQNYDPDQNIVDAARQSGVSDIEVFRNPAEAATDADVIYTDVWASMGQEAEAEERKKAFAGYQVNSNLLSRAKPGCLVMHCLPAHRGEEISEDVLEGANSIVFDEAENRLHVQKALILKSLE